MKKMMSFKIEPELKAQAEAAAKRRGMSLSEWIRYLMRKESERSLAAPD